MPKKPASATQLTGRKAQARSNDDRILEAARAVFLENPQAPVAAVARKAGVGISALYSRHRSKSALLARVCLEGLHRYIAAAERALANHQDDPFTIYAAFMREIVDADTHSNVLRFAGTFKPTRLLYREAARAQTLNLRLFQRTRAAGVLRPDIEATDIALLFEQLAALRFGSPARTARLRQRHLTLVLESLVPRANPAALPGPPATWDEINGRWG